jgi:CMP-N-acetylneuraminic acid synthetase
MKKKILALIPARGGSKRLPHKNIKDFCGKPLVSWTIEQAFSSRFIDKVVVSTDDEEIASVARNYGAEIPFLRSKELANDDSPIIDTIIQSINWFKKRNESFDILILLQPTSPLRSFNDIDKCIEIYLNEKPSSIISVSEEKKHLSMFFKIDNGYLESLLNDFRFKDLPNIFTPNGAIFVSSVNNICKSKSFYKGNILPYIMPSERSIDIDYEFDFKLSEFLMNEKRKE